MWQARYVETLFCSFCALLQIKSCVTMHTVLPEHLHKPVLCGRASTCTFYLVAHLHKSLHWSGASESVDLHGSSIQHLALSLRALFQDEDGFLSVWPGRRDAGKGKSSPLWAVLHCESDLDKHAKQFCFMGQIYMPQRKYDTCRGFWLSLFYVCVCLVAV